MSTNSGKTTGVISSKAQALELIDPEAEGHIEFIRRAHQRSVAAGLDASTKVDLDPLCSSNLRDLIDKNLQLRSCALPFMETLYEQVINTHSMVLLTDASGTIIESLGDDDFLIKAQKVALQPGVTWSENSKGTNAIGTALIEELPTVVHGSDHYLDVNRFLTCSAAPIFDPLGVPIGVLDVTGDYRSYHRHTMGLVRMSAQMIENHLFNTSFQDAIIVHFHQRGEFLGSVVEGAAAFSPVGKFLAANRAAMVQFGMSNNALKSHTFSSLFGMPISALVDHYRTTNPMPLTLCLHNGNQVTARASLGSVGRGRIFDSVGLVKQGQEPTSLLGGAPSQAQKTNQALQKNRHLSSLKYLNTGDPQVAKVIDKVGKVIDKDIPILILGETGTGKEILAQAIHNDSPRSEHPFVAVNCASIPETLIESELFGYEDGAFTGAKKKGAQGKILAANGGTLFLDEIGDMPISLQARLLRVLQERVVTPLGSQKSIPVNLQVICATHRNLRECIAAGSFREDLYYRLHGLVVKLPALRERSDIGKIVQRILENESHNPHIRISSDVLQAFESHYWPGNIRQLTNILRTASVMADEREVIEWEHLPDDFHDEWQALSGQRAHGAAFAETDVVPPTQDTPHIPAEDCVPPSTRPAVNFQVKGRLSGMDVQAPALQSGPRTRQSVRADQHNGQQGNRPPLFQVRVHGQAANPATKAFSQSTLTSSRGSVASSPARQNLDQTFSRFRENRFDAAFQPGQDASDTRRGNTQPMNQTGHALPQSMSRGMHSEPSTLSGYRNMHDARAHGYLGARQQLPRELSEQPINLDDLESRAIQEALETCRGNVSAAARMLGISRNTIYRRLNAK
ncbi:MAG: sigma 54-interacting transcriptional regulator [Limnobacter sp.]|uniref:sigma 54-interacting transcriptional regulator n=1 Tax=Limnobacter sp. TaxID=2003368 RepID=UPI00391969D6